MKINNTNFEPELDCQGGEDFDKPIYLQSLRRLAGRAYVKALVGWR